MVNYSCPRCNFTTHIKTKYVTHLKRKNICENIQSDDNLIEEYKKYNIVEKLKVIESTKSQQKSTLFLGSQQLVNNNTIYLNGNFICEYCERCFNFKQSYYRHMKTCKIKKEIDENEKDEMSKLVKLLNDQLDEKKSQINDQKKQINESQ